MEQEQIVKNMQNFLDKRVLILPPSIYAGGYGKTVRAEIPKGKEKAVMVVELDDGSEIEIDSASQIMFLTFPNPKP